MLLVTTFVGIRVVAGRSRTRAGRPHAVCGQSMLIHTCHAALCGGLDKTLSERHDRGMARARHGICESNTAALCKSNCKDTIKTLSGTAWQGTAWARHGMCELALILWGSGSQTFFNCIPPWQAISINCTLHRSKKFVINIVAVIWAWR
jgi:hypothetical protein